MKKVICLVLAAVMLVGLLGGAMAAYADTSGSGTPVVTDTDTVSPAIAGTSNFVQWQNDYWQDWQELLKLRQECDTVRDEIYSQYATLKPLVEQARKNHEQDKLDRLQPLMAEVKALESANQTIIAEKAELWQQFYQAILNGRFGQAEFLFDQIIRDKTMILNNLTKISNLLTRAIDIFIQIQPQAS